MRYQVALDLTWEESQTLRERQYDAHRIECNLRYSWSRGIGERGVNRPLSNESAYDCG